MSGAGAGVPVLRLPPPVRRVIVGASRSAWPEEACGFLRGRRDGRYLAIEQATACANHAGLDVRERYEIAPADCLAAHLEARAGGGEVLGVWHSHPGGACRPSVTDLALAWEGWIYLIVGQPESGAPALGAWWRCADGFREAEIEA